MKIEGDNPRCYHMVAKGIIGKSSMTRIIFMMRRTRCDGYAPVKCLVAGSHTVGNTLFKNEPSARVDA